MSRGAIFPAGYTPKLKCAACGAKGLLCYEGLEDHLFAIKGAWRMVRCSRNGCGLHWLDPSPLPDLLPTFYEQYHTHAAEPAGGLAKRLFTQAVNTYLAAKFGYASCPTLAGKIGRWIIQFTPTLRDDAAARVYWLDRVQNGKLLEVGFGNGATLDRLRRLGWNVVGVEFDGVSVELARKLGLEAHLGSLEDCDFDPNSFDAVVASHVIEHLPDPAGYFKECFRILKSDGRMVLTTPNASSLGHRLFTSNWRGLEPPRHLFVYSPDSLEKLARDAGFTRVWATTTARSGTILAQSLRLALGLNPHGAPRIEIELAAWVGWFFSLFSGRKSGEEIRLECRP
ncbi:bifunctional 2-polyprenyl-6-hydroxyphenol methylase/3-demethylubiquinol 3-O-methyltransferase UbiG [Rhodoferax sp. PAMC 29310]|uniref:class I SAM-dependent methyltransferase n=1 Tax=Rhodoferax sp. PAMC 29310 TaxID=2822760 RepID=UPI001B319A5C|nr:class I SAM-dependent methyltransferase [Rhodoferax sp. PAMC 29310]